MGSPSSPKRTGTIRTPRYDYDEFCLALGQRIKALRKERGMTQRKMVIDCGFHLTQVARMERGDPITLKTLLRVAEVFGMPPNELIAGLGEVHDSEPVQPVSAPAKKTNEVKPSMRSKVSKK